jgi:uncharacterized LabA/DUF88 family protein
MKTSYGVKVSIKSKKKESILHDMKCLMDIFELNDELDIQFLLSGDSDTGYTLDVLVKDKTINFDIQWLTQEDEFISLN